MPPTQTAIPGVRLARFALIVYALALTTGTHWPRLQLGTETVPAPDKLIHWVAFAGLALLVWASGLIPRLWLFALVVLGWPVLDELTQAIPALGRHISLLDLLAGELGAATVVAWRLVAQPVGGPANIARLRLERLAWRRALGGVGAWILILGAAALGALLVGGATHQWIAPIPILDTASVIALAAAVMGGLLAALAMAEAIRRQHWTALARRHGCSRCGATCDPAASDRHGRVPCPECGAPQWLGQWMPLGLSRARWLSMLLPSLALGLGIYLLIVTAYAAAVAAHGHVPPIRKLNSAYHRLPDDMRVVIDLTVLLFVAAIAAARFRASLARRVDRQDRRCLTCGHDLRGAVGDDPHGRCGECGRAYVRTPPPGERGGDA